MKITKNFSMEEFVKSTTAEKYKIPNIPSDEQIMNIEKLCLYVLQPIRERYGKPITITSGFRCKVVNKLVGGVDTSQHTKGEAADITAEDNQELFNLIVEMINKKEIEVGQLIDEKNYSWIHISLPTTKRNQIMHLS